MNHVVIRADDIESFSTEQLAKSLNYQQKRIEPSLKHAYCVDCGNPVTLKGARAAIRADRKPRCSRCARVYWPAIRAASRAEALPVLLCATCRCAIDRRHRPRLTCGNKACLIELRREKGRDGASVVNARLTPEQRRERARASNAAMTPEQRRERARAGGRASTASMTPLQRRNAGRAGGRAAAASMTPEQRSERSLAGWRTRSRGDRDQGRE